MTRDYEEVTRSYIITTIIKQIRNITHSAKLSEASRSGKAGMKVALVNSG